MMDLIEQGVGARLLRRRGFGVSQNFLNPGPENCQRRFEMMRSIRRKPNRLFETALQMLECLVQHRDQAGNFILGLRDWQALIQMSRADSRGCLPNFFNWAEGSPRYPPSA